MSEQCVAVKAIIQDEDGQVLLLRQSFNPEVEGAGSYHPPGGIVEPGETLHQALMREVQEETCLEVAVGEVIAVEEWRAAIRGIEYYFIGIFYACTITGGELDTAGNEESSGHAWIGPSTFREVAILEPSRSVVKKYLGLDQPEVG
jgi:ADP-ribose pyrophosphatase YjhB (NUDIX family)